MLDEERPGIEVSVPGNDSFESELQEDAAIASEVAGGGMDLIRASWRLIKTFPRIFVSLIKKLLHIVDWIARAIKWIFVHPLRFLWHQICKIVSPVFRLFCRMWIFLINVVVFILTVGTHKVVPRRIKELAGYENRD